MFLWKLGQEHKLEKRRENR